VWHDGAVVVVQGGGEQDLPPPAEGMEVLVPSKDAGHRLLTLLTTTQVLLPGSDEWSAGRPGAVGGPAERTRPPGTSGSGGRRPRWWCG
jgi:hypothetical protein